MVLVDTTDMLKFLWDSVVGCGGAVGLMGGGGVQKQ